jgi:hypothetical protein
MIRSIARWPVEEPKMQLRWFEWAFLAAVTVLALVYLSWQTLEW